MPFGRPFSAISLCVSFPGLKPWAVFCSPVGRLELAQENVQTPDMCPPGHGRSWLVVERGSRGPKGRRPDFIQGLGRMSKPSSRIRSCSRKLVASKSFLLFCSSVPPIESGHKGGMLAENERIAWAAISERTCICRMNMTLS